MFTLFLQVTWIWYLELGQSESSASWVSVSKLPIIPPPKTSHVTRHWCCSGSSAYQTMSAVVNVPSCIIERTDNSITSDESEVFVTAVAAATESMGLGGTTDDDRGAQLFQHWEEKKVENKRWKKKKKKNQTSHNWINKKVKRRNIFFNWVD